MAKKKKNTLKEKTFERLQEPSTYAGVAGLMYSLDQLFNLHGVAEIADAVVSTGTAVATGATPLMALGVFASSLMAMFMSEKKK